MGMFLECEYVDVDCSRSQLASGGYDVRQLFFGMIFDGYMAVDVVAQSRLKFDEIEVPS
jgi:hypothetical protein